MALKLTMTLKGTKEMRRVLRLLEEEAPQALGGAMWREATAIMNASKAIVPVRTATLKTSGHVQLPVYQGSTVAVTLGYGGAASKYAFYVHEGTRPHTIYPRHARVLHWVSGGLDRFAAFVRHPGTRATKYLQIPFDAAKSGMIGRLTNELRAAWQKRL